MLNLNQMLPFLNYKPGTKPGQCKRSAESTSEKSGDDKKKERKWVEAWRQGRADWLEYDTVGVKNAEIKHLPCTRCKITSFALQIVTQLIHFTNYVSKCSV